MKFQNTLNSHSPGHGRKGSFRVLTCLFSVLYRTTEPDEDRGSLTRRSLRDEVSRIRGSAEAQGLKQSPQILQGTEGKLM